jgi:hypothetical protein
MVTGQLFTKQTNRWRHGQRPKKCVRKRVTFFVRFCEYVELPFLLRVLKKYVSILERDKLISFITH